MDKLVIAGGNKLFGEISVSGAKNAAVAVIAGTALVKGRCTIDNIPNIKDVDVILGILSKLGAYVEYKRDGVVTIDCTDLSNYTATYEMVRKMRASYYLLGVLLGRFGNAEVALPGGCDFGGRPIDQHIKGFESMGATVKVEHGIVYASTEGGLRAGQVYLDMVTVGATVNIMLAAVYADGVTVIENAAKEPHVVDLANFLNSMGANIKGAGTDVIRIKGVDELHGGSYSIIPDQVEAGTFMIAAAATGGKLYINNVIPKHLETITAKLREMGVVVEEFDEAVMVSRGKGALSAVNVKTLPYPGFPTDMNPQMTVLLCLADGTSQMSETIWNNRFRYVDELQRMGAKIKVDDKTAVIEGNTVFTPACVRACDLRAGAAMVIAALATEGRTEIEEIGLIERGYDDIVTKLRNVGANIRKVYFPDGGRKLNIG